MGFLNRAVHAASGMGPIDRTTERVLQEIQDRSEQGLDEYTVMIKEIDIGLRNRLDRVAPIFVERIQDAGHMVLGVDGGNAWAPLLSIRVRPARRSAAAQAHQHDVGGHISGTDGVDIYYAPDGSPISIFEGLSFAESHELAQLAHECLKVIEPDPKGNIGKVFGPGHDLEFASATLHRLDPHLGAVGRLTGSQLLQAIEGGTCTLEQYDMCLGVDTQAEQQVADAAQLKALRNAARLSKSVLMAWQSGDRQILAQWRESPELKARTLAYHAVAARRLEALHGRRLLPY